MMQSNVRNQARLNLETGSFSLLPRTVCGTRSHVVVYWLKNAFTKGAKIFFFNFASFTFLFFIFFIPYNTPGQQILLLHFSQSLLPQIHSRLLSFPSERSSPSKIQDSYGNSLKGVIPRRRPSRNAPSKCSSLNEKIFLFISQFCLLWFLELSAIYLKLVTSQRTTPTSSYEVGRRQTPSTTCSMPKIQILIRLIPTKFRNSGRWIFSTILHCD